MNPEQAAYVYAACAAAATEFAWLITVAANAATRAATVAATEAEGSAAPGNCSARRAAEAATTMAAQALPKQQWSSGGQLLATQRGGGRGKGREAVEACLVAGAGERVDPQTCR